MHRRAKTVPEFWACPHRRCPSAMLAEEGCGSGQDCQQRWWTLPTCLVNHAGKNGLDNQDNDALLITRDDIKSVSQANDEVQQQSIRKERHQKAAQIWPTIETPSSRSCPRNYMVDTESYSKNEPSASRRLKRKPSTPISTMTPARLSSIHPAYRTPFSNPVYPCSEHQKRKHPTSPVTDISTLSLRMPEPVHLSSTSDSTGELCFTSHQHSPDFGTISSPKRIPSSPLSPQHGSSPAWAHRPMYLSSLLRTPPPAYISSPPTSPVPPYTPSRPRNSLEITLFNYGPANLVRLLAAENVWDVLDSPAIFGSTASRSCGVLQPLKPSSSNIPETILACSPKKEDQPLPAPQTPPLSPSKAGVKTLRFDTLPTTPPSTPTKTRAAWGGKSRKSPIRKLTLKVCSPLKKDISWPSLRRRNLMSLSALIDPLDVKSSSGSSPKRQSKKTSRVNLLKSEEGVSDPNKWMIRSPSGNLLDKQQWMKRDDRPLCLRERREAIMANILEKRKSLPEESPLRPKKRKRGCTAMLCRCFTPKGHPNDN